MKKIILNIILLLFILIPCEIKAEDYKFVVGITTGYSFGLTNEYKENKEEYTGGYNKYQDKLGFHFGLNFQYNFSSSWAIQGEIDYQRKTYTQEHIDYNNPSYNYSKSYDCSFIAPYLNVIYNSSKEKILFPYFSAGIGICQIAPEIVFMFKIGGGIKYHFFSRTTLNLEVSFNIPFLLRTLPSEIEYLSLNLGLEHKF